MSIITMDQPGQVETFRGGDYQDIARLGTVAATLKVRYPEGSARLVYTSTSPRDS